MLNKKWIGWRVLLEDKILNLLLMRRDKKISDFRDVLEKVKFERVFSKMPEETKKTISMETDEEGITTFVS